MLTAAQGGTEGGERRRQLALEAHRDRRERARLPLLPQQPEHVHVVVAAAVAVPVAQDALVAEADSDQRPRRAHVLRVRVRADPVHREQRERQVRDDRLRLAVGPGAPETAAEPGPDDAAAVADRELGQAGDAGRAVLAVDDEEVEALAPLTLGLEALDVR